MAIYDDSQFGSSTPWAQAAAAYKNPQPVVEQTTVFSPVKEIVDRYGDLVQVDAQGKDENGNVVIAGAEQPQSVVSPETIVSKEPANPAKTEISTYTDPQTGDIIVRYSDGTEAIIRKGTIQQDAAAKLAADEAAKKAAGQSAWDIMYNEFAQRGLGNLMEPLKNLITKGASQAELTMELRKTPAYAQRFPGNAQRIANGFAAIDEAAYLAKEDAYQQKMMAYGLPQQYWKPNALGTNDSYTQLLANDVPVTELEDRLIQGKKVMNATSGTIQAIKQFYPDITDGEVLAYVLNPKQAIKDIQRKVSISELGGAAIGEGLTTSQQRAEQLYNAGVTAEKYQAAAPFISSAAERGSQLADMYQQEAYNQATAEAEALGLAGSSKAAKQRKQLTSLEQASFGAKSGVGILDANKAGTY